MKTDYQIWNEEMARKASGQREFSSWPLVGACVVLVIVGIALLKAMH